MKENIGGSNIDIIANKYDIEFLVYFGSYKTKFYNAESDIDIGFLASSPLTVDNQLKLLEDLIVFHRKSEIDLVDLRKAEPVLRYEIARTGRVFYEKEAGVYERYRLFYIKRYYELRPIIEEEIKNIGKAIREVLDNVR